MGGQVGHKPPRRHGKFHACLNPAETIAWKYTLWWGCIEEMSTLFPTE